jgi:hypothetical protein
VGDWFQHVWGQLRSAKAVHQQCSTQQMHECRVGAACCFVMQSHSVSLSNPLLFSIPSLSAALAIPPLTPICINSCFLTHPAQPRCCPAHLISMPTCTG